MSPSIWVIQKSCPLGKGWIVKLKFITKKPTSEQKIKFDKAGNMQIRKHFKTSLFRVMSKVADCRKSNITGQKHMLFRNLNDWHLSFKQTK